MMDRDQALSRLRSCRSALEARGVTGLFLFGSTARGQARADSDLDLFVDYVEGGFDLLDLVAVKELLSDALRRGIDVTTRGGLHPKLRANIEREALKVF